MQHRYKRFLLTFVGVASSLSLLGSATFVHAATLTDAQIQAVVNLLQSFGADPSTVATVQADLQTTASSTPVQVPAPISVSASSTCATLSSNLSFGESDQGSGSAVAQLQAFLAKDKNIYPSGLVTGYFGSETEQAVQRWQAANGIVSSGDPSSTGFGYVGPRTRGEMNKEMELECEQADMQEGVQNSDTASSTTSGDQGGEGQATTTSISHDGGGDN